MSETNNLIRAILAIKHIPRQGWLDREVPPSSVESVAAHSLGVAALLLILDGDGLIPPGLSLERLLRLAIVHDLLEAKTGDLTPRSGIDLPARQAFEARALGELLTPGGRYASIESDIMVSVDRDDQDPHARFLLQVDKLDMMITALFYEQEHGLDLGEFHDPESRHLEDAGLVDLFRRVKRLFREHVPG